MPKDIQREFLTAPRKLDELMEKLEIVINEMMADDGPAPIRPGKRWCARCDEGTEWFGHEQRHVVRRCVCDRMERIQGWQRSRQARTERSRNVASWKRS